jgi:hypothetical protein
VWEAVHIARVKTITEQGFADASASR